MDALNRFGEVADFLKRTEMVCRACPRQMTVRLLELFTKTGKAWFGRPRCNKVFVYLVDPDTGQMKYMADSIYSLEEYREEFRRRDLAKQKPLFTTRIGPLPF